MCAPSVDDDSGWEFPGVVGADERDRDVGHGSADASFVPLPGGDIDRGRALGPDDLGHDAYTGRAALEALLDVSGVTPECVLGAPIPHTRVLELDAIRFFPERVLKNVPT